MNNLNDDKEKKVEENNSNGQNETENNPNRRKLDDEQLEDLMKKVNQMIDEVSDQYGVNPDNIKVMPIPKKKATFLAFLLTAATILVFDCMVIIAMSAIISWAEWESAWYLLFFTLFFAGSEILLKASTIPLLSMKIKNIYLLSFIKFLPFLLTSILCGAIPLFIKIVNYYFYAIIAALTYAIRNFYVMYFFEKNFNRIAAKITKNQINNKNKKKKEKKNDKKGDK